MVLLRNRDAWTDVQTVKMQIQPETPNFAAVVQGVDAKRPLESRQVDELKEALLRYKVLFFRGLHLTREEHLAFTTQFGDPYVNPSGFITEYDDEGVSEVTVVPNFHADGMYLPYASSFSMLRMVEMPSVGGDTMWADLTSSYNDLSETFRAFLESLVVVQASNAYYLSDEELAWDYKRRTGQNLAVEQIGEIRASLAPWECPLVRRIPETGGKNYWIAPQVTRGIKSMNDEEATAILNILFRHQLQPRYVYRWRWTIGDLAFWDHRTTLHCGIPDFGPQKRLGHRVSVGTNTPLAV
jgi:taurine dioxygenase